MTPVRAVKNQYQGVNAHLHSYWQVEGGWDGFHANHIADLMRLMSAQLLPLGYTADIQQSLQIRRLGEPAGKPESDVTIYDTHPARSKSHYVSQVTSAPAVAIPELMSIEDELAPYGAVAIYEYESATGAKGEPVAWVELLSPSNKPGGQDATYYHNKRLKLRSGVVFVEIDYLNDSPPTFDSFLRYSTGHKSDEPEPGSHPYHIVVVDPRPKFIQGMGYPYHFGVDEPVPAVDIPLNGNDTLKFDFARAYNKTFEETLYGARLVDYSQLPLNFDRYSQDDQLRILARMLAVLKAVRDGVDLETGAPLPIEDLPYDQALSQLTSWR